jgi:hypothetical protein
MRAITGFLAGIFISTQALALDLGSLSNADAVGGLKDALPLNSLRSPPSGGAHRSEINIMCFLCAIRAGFKHAIAARRQVPHTWRPD